VLHAALSSKFGQRHLLKADVNMEAEGTSQNNHQSVSGVNIQTGTEIFSVGDEMMRYDTILKSL